VHNAMFHPEGGSPRDETSRCARRQELNPALSVPGARFLFFWIEFLLSFPTQHQLRTLLLLRASACSLSSHKNLCSCGSLVAPNCVAHLRTLEVSSTKFWRVGLQRREFSFVGSESTFTAFYSASIFVGSKLRAQSSQV
jgi:hypothetical protein